MYSGLPRISKKRKWRNKLENLLNKVTNTSNLETVQLQIIWYGKFQFRLRTSRKTFNKKLSTFKLLQLRGKES